MERCESLRKPFCRDFKFYETSILPLDLRLDAITEDSLYTLMVLNDSKRGVVMGFFDTAMQESTFSVASGADQPYVVMQVTLKEKFLGTGSGNLSELEQVINNQARKGYRLHTISTSTSHSSGLAGGDRIQATLVFERLA